MDRSLHRSRESRARRRREVSTRIVVYPHYVVDRRQRGSLVIEMTTYVIHFSRE
jgi:hypothetical protein